MTSMFGMSPDNFRKEGTMAKKLSKSTKKTKVQKRKGKARKKATPVVADCTHPSGNTECRLAFGHVGNHEPRRGQELQSGGGVVIDGSAPCYCAHVYDEHGGNPNYPNSTTCNIEECQCIAFDADQED